MLPSPRVSNQAPGNKVLAARRSVNMAGHHRVTRAARGGGTQTPRRTKTQTRASCSGDENRSAATGHIIWESRELIQASKY